MSWVKKTSSDIILQNNSDVPYIISDKFLVVSNTNRFTENTSISDNYCSVSVPKSHIKRICAGQWYSTEFPLIVPVGSVNKVINKPKEDHLADMINYSVLVIISEGVRNLDTEKIEKLAHKYDLTFLVSENPKENEYRIRELDEYVGEDNHLYKTAGMWHNPMTVIADRLCQSIDREKSWMDNVPDSSVTVLGIQNSDEVEKMEKTLTDLSLLEKFDLSII